MARIPFSREQYDRKRFLARAADAVRKGKGRKAIPMFQRVLEVEPHDLAVHRKIVPLLTEARMESDALRSFGVLIAAEERDGNTTRAIDLCAEALAAFPRRIELWERSARIQIDRGRKAAALETLLQARQQFRRRGERESALRLALWAHSLAPSDVEVGLDACWLLRRCSRRDEARSALAKLAELTKGADLLRVRWQLLVTAPGWRTLRAWLAARRALANAGDEASSVARGRA